MNGIAEKWAHDWFTIAPAYRTKERLAKHIQGAIREAQTPEGWKLVPIQPITEQLKAMFDTPRDAPWLELYQAAINSAPEPPQ
jgi:hypothetical protein